ncbi:MAG: ACT domain-containing protein [Promethearchaeota archaeon]
MVKIEGNIKITVNAKDQPGELIRILQPLSDNGANIHGIFHDHDHASQQKVGKVPVEIIFTLDHSLNNNDRENILNTIKKELIEKKIEILSIFMEPVLQKQHVILIGHIFDTDIRDSIKQISTTGAQVSDLKANITSDEEVSTVMLTIKYDSDKTKRALLNKIRELCKNKNIRYITS